MRDSWLPLTACGLNCWKTNTYFRHTTRQEIPKMSRELILLEPRKIAYREIEDRNVRGNEVKIATVVSGISQGTEMRHYNDHTQNRIWDSRLRLYINQKKDDRPPRTLGYENIGKVVEVGREVKTIRPGCIVWTDSPHRETSIVSEQEAIYGLISSPSDNYFDRINPEHFIYFVRTRVALGAIHDSSIVLGERVVVIGLGVIGLIAIQLAKLNGSLEVYGIDFNPKRLEMARRLGAVTYNANENAAISIKEATSGYGVDVAIEASGSYAGLQEAIRCCCAGGRVITVGTYVVENGHEIE